MQFKKKVVTVLLSLHLLLLQQKTQIGDNWKNQIRGNLFSSTLTSNLLLNWKK